eukprot:m.198245 g.198245  ORF g.198245 m.198245 type:complete len:65 (-) comp32686_c0_seq1:3978-4172(-)
MGRFFDGSTSPARSFPDLSQQFKTTLLDLPVSKTVQLINPVAELATTSTFRNIHTFSFLIFPCI